MLSKPIGVGIGVGRSCGNEKPEIEHRFETNLRVGCSEHLAELETDSLARAAGEVG
jgi:hypothetical protein